MKVLAGTAFALTVLLSTSAFASSESDHLGRAVIERSAHTSPLANFTATTSGSVQKVAVAKSTDPARNVYSGK